MRKKKENRFRIHHPGIVTTLLIIFPPAAWIIMWKHEKYHSWFPKLLLFYTIPTLVIYFFQLFIVAPRLEVSDPKPLFLGIGLYLAQLMFYFVVKKEFGKNKKIEHALILIIIGILTLDTFIPMLIYYSSLVAFLLPR